MALIPCIGRAGLCAYACNLARKIIKKIRKEVNNMGRHIDADQIPYYLDTSDEAPMEGRKIAFKSDIDKIPTSDVVPRSEVEALEKEIKRLQSILNNYALRYGTVRDQRAVIDNAKAEVVRKIFEEIDSKILAEIDRNNGVLIEFEGANEPYHRIKGEVSALCKMQDFIAELKKKYPESEGTE